VTGNLPFKASSLPLGNHLPSAVSYKETFFLLGGLLSGGGYTNQILKYNTSEENWEIMTQKLSAAREPVSFLVDKSRFPSCG
jgi:hypothetical protein